MPGKTMTLPEMAAKLGMPVELLQEQLSLSPEATVVTYDSGYDPTVTEFFTENCPVTLGANHLMAAFVDQRSINQLMTDCNLQEFEKEAVWKKIGMPYTQGESETHLLDQVILALIGVALGAEQPFSIRMTRDSFTTWLTRQNFAPEEQALILEKMGWIKDEKKPIASIITRMCKALADREV